MKQIKIQCPAKINLSLKVLNKREDGFHNIESIMQTINLFDYLTIKLFDNDETEILLSGNNTEIPYNEKNLVYKAAKLFFNFTKIDNKKVDIYIDKNIPISAGLAGGSTDAAGTLYGLNKLLDEPLTIEELHKLCASLGSDLNVCLQGGRILCKGRGEIIEPQEFEEFKLSLIKPINIGISAKEAYTKFSAKKEKNTLGRDNFVNDLEWAILDDYKELQYIKQTYPKAIMTGSGSTYFVIDETFNNEKDYWTANNLKTIDYGVKN